MKKSVWQIPWDFRNGAGISAEGGSCFQMSDSRGRREGRVLVFSGSGRRRFCRFRVFEEGNVSCNVEKKPVIGGGINSFVKTALDNRL